MKKKRKQKWEDVTLKEVETAIEKMDKKSAIYPELYQAFRLVRASIWLALTFKD